MGGFSPLGGWFADLANAGIYVCEGDWGNAGLSVIFAIPLGGDAAAAITKLLKLMVKGDRLALKAAGFFIEKSKLQHFFTNGHAADFGIPGNWSEANGGLLVDVVDEWTSMYAPVPGSYHGMSGTWFFDAASETGLFFNAAGDLSTGFKFRPGQVSQFPYVKN